MKIEKLKVLNKLCFDTISKTIFTPLLICIYIWKIVKGVNFLSNILTSKLKLLVSQFSRFDFQNAKELK